jgi:hypothetical protein
MLDQSWPVNSTNLAFKAQTKQHRFFNVVRSNHVSRQDDRFSQASHAGIIIKVGSVSSPERRERLTTGLKQSSSQGPDR